MSKLNDSTLKILKKYRLDTNMSVFGNENELYNVIKVMDDMVGNQVSKVVSDIQYFDSSKPSGYSQNLYLMKSSNTYLEVSISPLSVFGSLHLVLDAVSMKTIGLFTGSTYPLGYLYSYSDQTIICYVGYKHDSNSCACFSDISCNNELTGQTTNFTGSVLYRPFLIITDKQEQYTGSEKYAYYYYLFGGVSGNRISSIAIEEAPILVPESIIDIFSKDSCYYHNLDQNFLRPYSSTKMSFVEV